MTLPTDPSRQHAKAVNDLIRAAMPVGYVLYEGQVNKPDDELTWPYIVSWCGPAVRLVDDLEGTAGPLITRHQLSAAGTTVDEVLAALDRAAAALHCVTPSIPGRACNQLRQQEGGPPPDPHVDPSVKTRDGWPIYYSFVIFELFSTPSSL